MNIDLDWANTQFSTSTVYSNNIFCEQHELLIASNAFF